MTQYIQKGHNLLQNSYSGQKALVEVGQEGQQNTGVKIKYVGCDTRNSVEVGLHQHGKILREYLIRGAFKKKMSQKVEKVQNLPIF